MSGGQSHQCICTLRRGQVSPCADPRGGAADTAAAAAAGAGGVLPLRAGPGAAAVGGPQVSVAQPGGSWGAKRRCLSIGLSSSCGGDMATVPGSREVRGTWVPSEGTCLLPSVHTHTQGPCSTRTDASAQPGRQRAGHLAALAAQPNLAWHRHAAPTGSPGPAHHLRFPPALLTTSEVVLGLAPSGEPPSSREQSGPASSSYSVRQSDSSPAGRGVGGVWGRARRWAPRLASPRAPP